MNVVFVCYTIAKCSSRVLAVRLSQHVRVLVSYIESTTKIICLTVYNPEKREDLYILFGFIDDRYYS